MCLFAFMLGILAQNFFFPSFFLLIFLSNGVKRAVVHLLLGVCGWLWMWVHQLNHFDSISGGYHQYSGIVQGFLANQQILVKLTSLDHRPHQAYVRLHFTSSPPKLFPGETWEWQGRQWQARQSFWYQDAYRHIDGHVTVNLASLIKIQSVYAWDVMHRLQIACYKKAYALFKDDFTRSLFLTLVLGLGSELDVHDWDLFKLTGTAHLMVVSGAHLALLMTLVSFLVGWLWRLIAPLNYWVPRKKASSLLALGLGLIYALITGFSIPVKRAWLMMAMRWLHYIYPRRISSWQALRWSFAILVFIEPHTLFYPATYLSYVAVLIVMYITQLPFKSRYVKAFLVQLACIFGMAPLTILWFDSIPVLGLAANFFAIPWVSWVLLPCGLVIALGDFSWVQQIFHLASLMLKQGLTLLSSAQCLNIHWQWPRSCDALIILSLMAIVAWLPTVYHVGLFALSLLMILSPHDFRLQAQHFMVEVLDVGQGLSVLVRTQDHRLLFDTATLGAASTIVLPYLKRQGIQHIDDIVLSHHDNDHDGGLPIIYKQYPKSELFSSYGLGKNCHQLSPWVWNQVRFEFLSYRFKSTSKNNHSCVLKISNQTQSIILTADIERLAEYQLIYRHQQKLAATVLLVPHHGSQTSSSFWFLDMVKPKLAILSVAQHNRYHLPHPQVMKRYEKMAIPYLSTAQNGGIQLYFLGNRLLTQFSKPWSWRNWFR